MHSDSVFGPTSAWTVLEGKLIVKGARLCGAMLHARFIDIELKELKGEVAESGGVDLPSNSTVYAVKDSWLIAREGVIEGKDVALIIYLQREISDIAVDRIGFCPSRVTGIAVVNAARTPYKKSPITGV